MAKQRHMNGTSEAVATEERPATNREDPLLTFKEVAVQIGVDQSTIARWSTQMGRRRLKTVRLPSGRRKVRQSVVDAILQACADGEDSTEEIQ